MANTLNDAQIMFTFLFGIYFALSIPLTGKFQPFDTPSIYNKDWRAAFRLVFSVLWLAVLPVGYYVLVLKYLAGAARSPFEFWAVLALLMFSLTGFGFYRIYFGLMLLKQGRHYFFYGTELPRTLMDEWKLRPKSHRNWKAHVLPGLCCAIITTAWGYLSTQPIPVTQADTGKEMEIFANKAWQDTGIRIQAGQYLKITYLGGQWSQCAGYDSEACIYAGADGLDFESPHDNVMASGCKDAKLIARVAGYSPWCIGRHFDGQIDQTGYLALRINDALIGDNDGRVSISIEIQGK